MTSLSRAGRALRATTAVTLAGLSIAALAGCASTPAASPTPTQTPTPTVTVTPTPKPTATATATATSTPAPTTTAASAATPVSIDCSDLVFDSTIASVAPGFAADPGFEIGSGGPETSFSDIASLRGTVCSWLNSSTGQSIGVAVGKPGSAALATDEARVAAAGTSTTAFSDGTLNRGYVASNSEAPSYDLFTDSGYWISVSSVVFTAPSDAKSIFANVLQTLPSG